MGMKYSTAGPIVACCVVFLALVGCSTDDVSEPSTKTAPSSESTSAELQTERADALAELARSASERAAEMPSPPSGETDPAPTRSNAETLAKGVALLRNGGVSDVGEAEPPHGDSDADVGGKRGDHLVYATVRDMDAPKFKSKVVGTNTVAGVRVETVEKPFQSLRFEHGAFRVYLRVLDESNRYLDQETRELLQVILCPSECGGLPDGADG